MSRRKRDHNSTLSHWTTKSKWSKWMKHQVHLDAKQKFDVLTEPGRTCWVFWGAFSEAWTSRRHWWPAPSPPQPCFDWSLRSSISGPGFLFGSLLLLFEPQALPGRYNLDQFKIKLTYYKIKKTTNAQNCQTNLFNVAGPYEPSGGLWHKPPQGQKTCNRRLVKLDRFEIIQAQFKGAWQSLISEAREKR